MLVRSREVVSIEVQDTVESILYNLEMQGKINIILLL